MSSSRASLEDRLKLEEHSGTSSMADTAVGSKQLTFTLKKVNSNSVTCPVMQLFKAIECNYTNNAVCTVNQMG